MRSIKVLALSVLLVAGTTIAAMDPADARNGRRGAFIAGALAGAVLGGAIIANRHHYNNGYYGRHYVAPRHYAPVRRHYRYHSHGHYHRLHRHRHVSRHVSWCSNRYRSYNPNTNHYLAYSGRYRPCRSPYGY